MSATDTIIMAALEGGERFGRDICREFKRRAGRKLPYGSLYTTLKRMQDKGLVSSREGESNPDHGGNHRLYYALTDKGREKLTWIRKAVAA
jgi:PadR family transcriptional regulator, regulatory protein PadR